LFATDLRQLGHVFFPGEEISVAVPPETDLTGTVWQIDVSAVTPDEGMRWEVTVAARGPAGAAARTDSLERGATESPRTFDHRLRRVAKGLLIDVLGELRGFRPGWGMLTGVRPTKLVHQMLDQGISDPEQELISQYRVSPEKASLVTGVARLQRPYLNQDPRAISLYIGIPFCPSI
jgi:oxygen-independent coproporphyrinogen-3 oxidase